LQRFPLPNPSAAAKPAYRARRLQGGFSYAAILLYTDRAFSARPVSPVSGIMTKPVVTRFAPSPTGFLHIGGARTALFNWLFARHHGGKMLLRIEDTDRERSTDAAIAAILDGLKWLGLDWDGDVVYQFQRAERHREVVAQLLASGNAYRCYATQDELAAMREKARAEGRTRLYNGLWRERDPAEAPAGVAPVIRLKAPLTGETVIEDQVQGRVVWQNENLDDLVLLRSDGNPTYMLAVVADDHDMDVTHIIRGDDHLTNAARQKQIYDALDWELPSMAHIPLIHGPDGSKLSKRHGALGVDAYRAMGYLPEALRNYLVRLGWSHGDQEIFSTQEMIDAFDLPAIGRSAARFDFAKLENLNGHYIRNSDDQSLVTVLANEAGYLPNGAALKARLNDTTRDQLRRAMPGLKERAKTLIDLIDGAHFIVADRPLPMDAKAAALLTPETRQLIGRIRETLATVTDWSQNAVEATMRAFAEQNGLKLGSVAQPLRVALTGRTTSPGIFDVLAVLGRDECLGRLADQAAA
jgi:glutamyl-tRNA synthetase